MERQKVKQLIKSYQQTYIFAMSHIHQAISEISTNTVDLSIEQFFVLREIAAYDGISATELAATLSVNKSAITPKLKKLVDKGYIQRKRNQQDKRAIVLTISEKGNNVYEACEKQLELLVNEWLEILGEKDSEHFFELFQKITKSVVEPKK
ncbi:MarR family winged helix-turn-helix transcriptional regulator [Listeria cossartiae subsp. cayugensis]|uniref:MarR family winged helix-turn-helix transcriptional regulator n=1 Tax=Listeria cossartiae TaxID=2838249 RepID=UPI00288059FE|nr:MarR family winged helix-turn-helix transcriptional regulator [Listeria cossartiae]MDT0002827.1 MarR family winged helix-turn-helix transcriptional regulator [Listeria cossartiae subsp. cayugensis]MDT0018805.1 MarR family winged helix-turn-helix transcriptional regulator [Listeria cossartiae subsp. cayugensis]MDT0035622.1 MarR family winged helix-turn-helix transcriptional regulator [Listeria cossartiae subsp. cayugensis]MDT0040555.1 MarR family winged helix-turn-helix transcriptional regula